MQVVVRHIHVIAKARESQQIVGLLLYIRVIIAVSAALWSAVVADSKFIDGKI